MQDKTVINTAPPPPSEVKVRTMRSDLEAMRQSGGGMPSFQNVSVLGLSLEKELQKPAAPIAFVAPSPAASAAGSNPPPVAAAAPASTNAPDAIASDNHLTPLIIVSIVGALALIGVAIVAYILFFK